MRKYRERLALVIAPWLAPKEAPPAFWIYGENTTPITYYGTYTNWKATA
jgi:hypothetical protein